MINKNKTCFFKEKIWTFIKMKFSFVFLLFIKENSLRIPSNGGPFGFKPKS